MKVAFLCGSLEPGRDGVGDYTRRLAGELTRQGQEVCLVSLNDQHADGEIHGTQDADGTLVGTLRLPAAWSRPQRASRARDEVEAFDPDWLSLQFVPYSFHPKGLPFGLHRWLESIGGARPWHVMAHEIWLDDLERVRHRLVAHAQRRIVRQVLSRLRPHVIDVSNRHNQRRLAAIGHVARSISMSGGVPISLAESPPEKFREIASCRHRVLYFGTPPVGQAASRIVDGIAEFAKNNPSLVGIAVAGGNDGARRAFIDRLDPAITPHGARLVDFGFLQSGPLSALLQSCNASIVRNSGRFFGKSSAAISFLEHGLPVWMPLGYDGEPLDWTFRREMIFTDLNQACHTSRLKPESLLPASAASFVAAIEHAASQIATAQKSVRPAGP